MIISRPKEFDEILENLKEKDIFIIGCGKCAKKLRVGGEPEVLGMKTKLKSSGKNITGWTVLSSACTISSWEELLAQNPGIKKAEALLVMSCGGGVSVISRFAELAVYPALNTESLGGVCRDEVITEQCGMCGECSVWEYGGICPVIRCAKSMLNGPCGGAVEGKCEVDERICAWDAIYERLKMLNKGAYLEIVKEPKDHSRKLRRQRT
ncbi:Uncharacterised protein [uncultured archaeon]|nr:Uncharacterised protein [uncultured archaeon]